MSLLFSPQKTERSHEEWIRIGEEAERIKESDVFAMVLEEVEYDLIQKWVQTPAGQEGTAVREAIHAQIAGTTLGLDRAFQTLINMGEYARTVRDAAASEE